MSEKENRVEVVHINDFNEEEVEKFFKQTKKCYEHNEGLIPVYIDSSGGSVHSAFAMGDILRSFKEATILTCAIGKAMSAGSFLLTFGDEGKRLASPSSTIMIHQASSCESGKTKEIINDTKELERINNLFLETISKNCGQPKKYFSELIDQYKNVDIYLTPQDAKKHNIINKVGIPHFEIKERIKIIF